MLEQIMNTNKVAAKEAATLTTTNAVNDILAAKVGEFLPENAKEFLKTPLGKLAMANAVVMLSTTFADSIGRSNAKKVEVFGRSMVTSAMVETLAAFNVAELMKELAGVVDLPEFQESINKA